jgi:Sulfate permease and related transporters (MFS superfamily)
MGNWFVSLLGDWKERFTPYRSWLGELKNPEVLKADAMAGLTVALVLIPQSMAYAQLAGLPAYIGLYASFLSGHGGGDFRFFAPVGYGAGSGSVVNVGSRDAAVRFAGFAD